MIIGFLFLWLLTAVGLWVVTGIVPGVRICSPGGLWTAALVLGLVNAFIRPLLWLLTLPLTLLTFGLFALVINALMIKLTAALVTDLEVDGFVPALLAAVVMSLLALIGFGLLQWSTMGEVHWLIEHNSNPAVGIII